MRSIARIFGAPDTVPAGKHARNASSASTPGASSPSTTDVRCITWEKRSTRMSSRTRTVPAREVDQHDVLGSLLPRCAKLSLHRGVLGVVAATRPRPGDRVHHDTTILDPDEWLGRGADERGPRDVNKEHVGRGVHVPQRAVERERLGGRSDVESLRKDDLDAVAV